MNPTVILTVAILILALYRIYSDATQAPVASNL